MNQSNAAIIRKAYEDFAGGNIPAVFGAFDANITWHVPSHSPLSGDFAGHDQIGGIFQGGIMVLFGDRILLRLPVRQLDVFVRLVNFRRAMLGSFGKLRASGRK